MSFAEKPFNEQVDVTYRSTKTDGKYLRGDFEKNLSVIGFDTQLIAQHGALVCDVEYGPEIPMLAPLQPSVLIATEPQFTYTEALLREEMLKAHVLERLTADVPSASIVRAYPHQAIQLLLENDPAFRVALVTRLNVFPDYVKSHAVHNFIQTAGQILIPGGLVVVTCREHDYGIYLERVKTEGIDGFEMQFSRPSLSYATVFGRGILTAKKL